MGIRKERVKMFQTFEILLLVHLTGIMAVMQEPSCEQMAGAHKSIGRVRIAYGCDLGNITNGLTSTCDDAVLTSLKSCSKPTTTCIIKTLGSHHECKGHADVCQSIAKVHSSLQQNLLLWCEPTPTNDCPCTKLLSVMLPLLLPWLPAQKILRWKKSVLRRQLRLLIVELTVSVNNVVAVKA